MHLLIDANNLLHRAFHALISQDNGEHVHAVTGFVNMLLTCIEDYRPDGIHLAFDTWPIGTNLRLRISESYKAERDRDVGVYIQINKARQLCTLAGLSVYYQEGYEADDLIATLAHPFGDDRIIISNDGDLMQLATNRIGVTKIAGQFAKRQIFYQGDVYGHYGIWPSQIVDYKALFGDISDNVAGVDGIGEVWAKNLIRRYGSLKELYRTLEERGEAEGQTLEGKIKKSKSISARLIAGKESAFLAQKLCGLMIVENFTVQSGDYKVENIHQAMRKMGIAK